MFYGQRIAGLEAEVRILREVIINQQHEQERQRLLFFFELEKIRNERKCEC